jgi:hypothetical protein
MGLPNAPIGHTGQFGRGEEPSGLVWVRDDPGAYLPHIRLSWDDPPNGYDVREAYQKALAKKNPYLSPHAVFRGLANNNNFQLVSFLGDFGPLDIKVGSTLRELRSLPASPQAASERRREWLVDVQDFWRRQRKYKAVMDLWNVFADADRLRAALVEGSEYFSSAYIDAVALRRLFAEARRRGSSFDAAEPTLEKQQADDFVQGATASDVRLVAEFVIQAELESAAIGTPWWEVENRKEQAPGFRLAVRVESLWAAMWQCFAQDTHNGMIWRICPHCGKVFWPPRKDRFFCTPELQQLHSKREWWNHNRRQNRKERES